MARFLESEAAYGACRSNAAAMSAIEQFMRGAAKAASRPGPTPASQRNERKSLIWRVIPGCEIVGSRRRVVEDDLLLTGAGLLDDAPQPLRERDPGPICGALGIPVQATLQPYGDGVGLGIDAVAVTGHGLLALSLGGRKL